jgi:hypothetical protein
MTAAIGGCFSGVAFGVVQIIDTKTVGVRVAAFAANFFVILFNTQIVEVVVMTAVAVETI